MAGRVTTDGAITIRPATEADREALIDLKWAISRAEHAFIPEHAPTRALLDLSREAAARGVDGYWRAVHDNGGEYFVAERDGRVIGSVLWYAFTMSAAFKQETAQMGCICGLVTAPDARGVGLGKRLLAFIEDRIHSAGRHAFLEVTYHNAVARGLYEAAGYAPLEVSMIKRLGGAA